MLLTSGHSGLFTSGNCLLSLDKTHVDTNLVCVRVCVCRLSGLTQRQRAVQDSPDTDAGHAGH